MGAQIKLSLTDYVLTNNQGICQAWCYILMEGCSYSFIFVQPPARWCAFHLFRHMPTKEPKRVRVRSIKCILQHRVALANFKSLQKEGPRACPLHRPSTELWRSAEIFLICPMTLTFPSFLSEKKKLALDVYYLRTRKGLKKRRRQPSTKGCDKPVPSKQTSNMFGV